MEKQLIRDFEKSFENSNLDSQKINLKKEFLNKFIKEGLPGKNLENWKILKIILKIKVFSKKLKNFGKILIDEKN